MEGFHGISEISLVRRVCAGPRGKVSKLDVHCCIEVLLIGHKNRLIGNGNTWPRLELIIVL